MSLIQANFLIFRYATPEAPADITVSYGTGKDRVPPEYSEIHRIAMTQFEEMTLVTRLQKELLSKMPDVVFTITSRVLIPIPSFSA